MTITIEILKRKTKSAISRDGKLVRTHTENYRLSSTVQINQFQAGLAFEAQTGALPFALCAYDQQATLQDFDCETEGTTRDPWRFLIELIYSTETPSIKKDDDPLNDPVEVDTDTREEKRSIIYDRDGNLILNYAKDPYEPAIEIPVSNVVLTFVRNEPTFVPGQQYATVDHVNATAIFGAEPGDLKCMKYKQSRKSRNQRIYWQTTYEFEHSRFGWQPKPLNQGRRQVIAKKKDFIPGEKDRTPISDPLPLYKVKAADVAGALPHNVVGATPTWKLPDTAVAGDAVPIPPENVLAFANFDKVDAIPEAEFNDLGLPYAQV